jgi:hypothetical protein
MAAAPKVGRIRRVSRERARGGRDRGARDASILTSDGQRDLPAPQRLKPRRSQAAFRELNHAMAGCLKRLKLIIAHLTMIWIRFDDLHHHRHRVRDRPGVLTPTGIEMRKMLFLDQLVFASHVGGHRLQFAASIGSCLRRGRRRQSDDRDRQQQSLNQRAAGVSPSCGNCRCHNVCTAGSPCPQCRNLPPVGPTRQWRRGETLYFPASRSAKSATVLA